MLSRRWCVDVSGYFRRIAKGAQKLKKTFEPGSNLQRKQDRVELIIGILELQELLQSLPLGESEKWSFDMRIAMKGIVQKAPVGSLKEEKPDLVVEDDLY